MLQASLHMDRQALARVLVDDGQHTERAAVMRPVGNEVIRPDMAFVLRPESDARAIVEPEPASLGLLLRDLEPFASPDAFHPLCIDRPAFAAEQRGDPAVAVSAILLS